MHVRLAGQRRMSQRNTPSIRASMNMECATSADMTVNDYRLVPFAYSLGCAIWHLGQASIKIRLACMASLDCIGQVA